MEVRGYPNYLIYPDGRVWTKRRPKVKGGFLKPPTTPGGYLSVTLRNEGKYKTFTIHRLVATHYLPNPDNLEMVDHINRDKKDNRVENLKWVTRSQNGHNSKIRDRNKLQHKNISPHNEYFVYQKYVNTIRYHKYFKTLKEALCYKYIFTLKMRAGLV